MSYTHGSIQAFNQESKSEVRARKLLAAYEAISEFFRVANSTGTLGSMSLDDIYSFCINLSDVQEYIESEHKSSINSGVWIIRTKISFHVKFYIDSKE